MLRGIDRRTLGKLLIACLWLTVMGPHGVAAQSAFLDDDLLAREVELNARLVETRELRRNLVREDRRARPIYPGLIAMGVGFGVSAASSFLLLLNELTQHGTAPEQAARDRGFLTTFYVAHAVGIPLAVGGLVWSSYQVHKRPHRSEVQALEANHTELRRELKRTRRERRLRERARRRAWSLAPSVSLARASLGFQLRHSF